MYIMYYCYVTLRYVMLLNVVTLCYVMLLNVVTLLLNVKLLNVMLRYVT